ncbi:MAG: YcjF family protein [Halomonas sp.]|uniref:TIGR01620 family protein n=1 Tax=Halomonas sp. TaxID=1486246 RepID=UPI00397115E4
MNQTRDPRPSQRFSAEAGKPDEAEAEASSPDPRPAEAFDAELTSRPLADEPPGVGEQALEASLARPRRRRWGLFALLSGTLGLGAVEAAGTLYAASLGGHWLASAWSLLMLLALALGGSALARELWRLRRLRRHDRLRERLEALPEAASRETHATAESLRRCLALDDDHPHWQGFLAARQAHHDGRDIQLLLDHHLLAPRDREASRLISRMSGETAIMVAVSPLTLVDMALVAWRSLAMIDRLCRLYGLELSYPGRIRLLRSVLYQMAFAGATEMAGDAGMQMLSMNLAGRLSTRAAQGMGVGLLSARLGLRTQRLTRPLPFSEENLPRLGDLRRELWQQLRRLEADVDRTA